MITSPVPEVSGTAPEAVGRKRLVEELRHATVGAGEMRQPGRRAGSPRKPQRSPLACRPRSPGTRSARAPRRSSATSRPMLRSRTRSCSLGAARVAAFGSSAWTYGGSWSRSLLPVCRFAPRNPCPSALAPAPLRFSLLGWIKTLMGTIVHVSPDFAGQQRRRVDERTQFGVWQDV